MSLVVQVGVAVAPALSRGQASEDCIGAELLLCSRVIDLQGMSGFHLCFLCSILLHKIAGEVILRFQV